MAINTIADLSVTPANNIDYLGSNATGAGNAADIDAVRQNLGAIIARAYADMGGMATVAGTNTITVTSNSTYQTLENGLMIAIVAANSNTGATTLNLDALGAKSVRLPSGGPLVGGEIVQGGWYQFRYDSSLNAAAGGWSLLNPAGIANLTDPNADRVLFWDDSAGRYAWLALAAALEISGTTLRVLETFTVAISDESTAITTGTAKVTFRMPFAATLTAVRASLSTASSSGIPTFDINEGGTTVLSTKLTVDANEKTSTTAATAAVISDSALADDAEITIDVDVAGTGAKGAKITFYWYR